MKGACLRLVGWEKMASSPKPPLSGVASSSGRKLGVDELKAWMLQYGPALRSYFLRRTQASDADDLVQDVFLALQARGAAGAIDNVEGYLFRTAAHVLSRRHRHKSWAWGSQEDLDDVEGLVDELSPERILIGRQAIALVLAGLDALPPRTAQAFFLYRFEHMSQEAVAKRMGVSVKAVEKFIRRALRLLLDDVGPKL